MTARDVALGVECAWPNPFAPVLTRRGALRRRIRLGVALVLLTLFFPQGLLGTLRSRYVRWLP